MATAHAGLAMGRRGSDLALQTADAVVIRDDLKAVPAVLQPASRARRVVHADLAIAGTVVVVLVAWDLFWHCLCRSASPVMKAPPSSWR